MATPPRRSAPHDDAPLTRPPRIDARRAAVRVGGRARPRRGGQPLRRAGPHRGGGVVGRAAGRGHRRHAGGVRRVGRPTAGRAVAAGGDAREVRGARRRRGGGHGNAPGADRRRRRPRSPRVAPPAGAAADRPGRRLRRAPPPGRAPGGRPGWATARALGRVLLGGVAPAADRGRPVLLGRLRRPLRRPPRAVPVGGAVPGGGRRLGRAPPPRPRCPLHVRAARRGLRAGAGHVPGLAPSEDPQPDRLARAGAGPSGRRGDHAGGVPGSPARRRRRRSHGVAPAVAGPWVAAGSRARRPRRPRTGGGVEAGTLDQGMARVTRACSTSGGSAPRRRPDWHR